MADRREASLVNSKLEQRTLCEECKKEPSKYKCPGCSIRSCSLSCVKAHKERIGCIGKRQLTDFVPLSKFDDKILLSDYNMLEDVKRVAESSQRMREKLSIRFSHRLPHTLRSLQRAAASRSITLLFVSSGMSRRGTNQSHYKDRSRSIHWTIEWRFHSTDVVLIDHGVDENTNLRTVIKKHLEPGPWNHPLKQFCEEPLDSLNLFLCKFPERPRSTFRELDITTPIRELLANLVVLEYPVIHVLLPSQKLDFEVTNDLDLNKQQQKDSLDNSNLSQDNVTFKEEEIKDEKCLDPLVLDVMRCIKSNASSSYKRQKITSELNGTVYEQEFSKGCQGTKPVLEKGLAIREAEVVSNNIEAKAREFGSLKYMDFEFDQELIDAYTNLIAQNNPDNFLDLESLLVEGVGQGDKRVAKCFDKVLAADDALEEGEIPSS